MRLTSAMREALLKARAAPLRRIHDQQVGKPPWPAHSASLAALVRHGLLHRDERRNKRGWPLTEWTITDAGRQALNPPLRVKRDTVTRLHVPGGTTRMMQGGEWVERWMPEPEQVKNAELDRAWFGAALQRHAAAADKRAAARAVRQHARRAA